MHPWRNARLLLGVTLFALALLFCFTVNRTSAEEGMIACRGESITIGATLLQNGTYGDPVPDQRIEFFEQTHNVYLGSVLTNPSGVATIQWNIPMSQPLGVSIVNATFRGNQSLALSPSCEWAVITILSHTGISIHVDKDALAPGDMLTLTATLLNDKGDALPNACIAVFCGTTQLESGTTNASGQVHFAINCNSTWEQLGTNRMRVFHEREMSTFSETAKALFNVSIQQLPSTLILVEPPKNPIKLNDNLQSYVLLMTNGIATSGVQLEILLDSTSLALASTNQSGIASVCVSTDSRFSLGSHELAVRYPGTPRYASSLLKVQIDIVSPSLVRVILPAPMTTGTQANITVELSDLLGRPLSGAWLRLRDLTTNQTITQQAPLGTTLVNINLQVLGREGARSFVLDILGNEYILNRSCAFGAVIWVRPKFDIVYSDIMGYASPGQEFLMELRLADSERDYANTPVDVRNENVSEVTMHTNQSGIISIRFSAPEASGMLRLSFIYRGNASEYRLFASVCYAVVVTERMPVTMKLYDYQLISPLQQIHVRLMLRALNGSLLAGVLMNYEWLSTRGSVLSGRGGIADLYLSFPNQPGSFNLSYWIDSSRFLLFSAGYTIISLNSVDISSIEGAGVVGFAVSACLSVLAVSIPAARRKYLLD